MRLYLVRHTRVDMPAGICYGNSDVELADTFCQELLAVKSQLEGIRFARTYSSPLKRCALLAGKLSENGAIIDERIREYDFGEWECMPWDDIYALEKGKEWFDDYVNTPCPQGESFGTMLERVRQFVRSLPQTDGNTLIVTHAGIIRAFLILLKNCTIDEAFDRKIGYGEIITIETNEIAEHR